MYEAGLSTRQGVTAPLTSGFFIARKALSTMDNNSKTIASYAITKPAQSTNILTEWQTGALLLTMQRRIAGLIATLAELYLSEPVIAELQKLELARIEDFIPTRADADLWEHWQDATAAGLNGTGWGQFTSAEITHTAELVKAHKGLTIEAVAQIVLVATGYTPEDARRLLEREK